MERDFQNYVLKQKYIYENWDLTVFLYMPAKMIVYYFIRITNRQLNVQNIVSLGTKSITRKEKRYLKRF